jgi:hypothetical protein
MTFDSPEHRDYYSKVDPAHSAFKSVAKIAVEKVMIADFSDGEWKS